MAASAAAEGDQPGFRRRLGINVTQARRDKVLGEMRIGQDHLTDEGVVHSAAILGFAEELAGQGAALAAPAGRVMLTLEAKANYFRRCRSGILGGEARPLHLGGSTMVWQSSIYEPDGAEVAVVTHTLILLAPDAAQAEEAVPAAGKRASGAVQMAADAGRRAAERTGASSMEKRREVIAAAACDVIARKGFAGATIREIADAAGLHVPTLYQYVSSKDEVLELVYSWAMERLRTDFDAATTGCATARDKLVGMMTAMIANSDRNRRKVGVLNRELKSLPQKSRLRVLAQYRGFLDQIAALIAEGVASGEFRPVEPSIAANFVEAMSDVWPLRQFAVGTFGLEAFQKEAALFVEAALARRD
jgi:uncharacterized protein (TIGR00369 family)